MAKKKPDKDSKKKKKNKRNKTKSANAKTELTILAVVAAAAFFVWNTPVIYPVKLLVVALHEISHAIATIFTGGSVVGMEVSSELYGTVNSEGGNEFLIASSGYLGSLFFGFLIFLSASKKKFNIILSTAISVLLLLFVANFFRDPISIVILLLYSLFFYISPRYLSDKINYWIMRVLGMLSSFYVIFDIKEDLLTTEYLATDADKLAMITTVPAIYWSLLWFTVSVVVIYFMFKEIYYDNVR